MGETGRVFEDDMLKLGERWAHAPCWPPPEIVETPDGQRWRLVRFSQITDEQRARMTHVFRGAEYEALREGTDG